MPAPPVLVTFAPKDQGVAPTIQEIRAGIASIGAEARHAGTTTQAGFSNVLVTFRTLSHGVAQATADFKAGVITARQYAEALAMARGQAVTLRQSLTDLSTKELHAYDTVITRTTTTTGRATQGMSKLRGAVLGLATQMVGLPGPVGQVTSAFATLAGVGTKLGLIGVAFAGIAIGINRARKETEELTRALEEQRDRLQKHADAFARLEATPKNLALLRERVRGMQETLAESERIRTGQQGALRPVTAESISRERQQLGFAEANLSRIERAIAEATRREVREAMSALGTRPPTEDIRRVPRTRLSVPGPTVEILPIAGELLPTRETVEAQQRLEALRAIVGEISDIAVPAMAGAFANVFSAIAEGAKVSGAQFAAGLLGAISQAAAHKAGFYFAEGLAALAASIFPFPNPANKVASGMYFKAAALMAGIAVGTGLAARAVGGGGGPGGAGGLSGGGFSDLRRGVAEKATPPLTLVFKGDINYVAPNFVDGVAKAIGEGFSRNVIVIREP